VRQLMRRIGLAPRTPKVRRSSKPSGAGAASPWSNGSLKLGGPAAKGKELRGLTAPRRLGAVGSGWHSLWSALACVAIQNAPRLLAARSCHPTRPSPARAPIGPLGSNDALRGGGLLLG